MLIRSFHFWIYLNAAVWFATLIILLFALLVTFDNTNPGDEQNFDGMTEDALAETRTTLFEIYSPYLGIIAGCAVALFQNKKKITSRPLSMMLPTIVLGLGLSFNLYFLISFFNFIQNNGAEYQDLLQHLQSFAKYWTLVTTAAMSYFFDLGYK